MSVEPVIIIGAGPAGLTAAYELSRKGDEALVFEKADKVGGIARTENCHGHCFDIGGHRFFTKNRQIRHLWETALGQDFLTVQRKSRIFYQGKFLDYPLNIMNVISQFSIRESIRVILSYMKVKIRPNPREDTFDQWVENRFGSRLYHLFFKSFTEKVWGVACDQISADWAVQRIKSLSLTEAILNALTGRRKAHSLIHEFHYPSMGSGMMWRKFQEKAEANGSRISLQSEITGISHNGKKITGVSVRTPDTVRTSFTTRHLISSIPLPRLVSLMDPRPPDNVIEASRRLEFRSFILVVLAMKSTERLPDQWLYIHDADVNVGRIQFINNWSPALVAEPDTTLIGMEYFCSRGDRDWALNDTQLADRAEQELTRLGLLSGHVANRIVVREPFAYPVYSKDYGKHLALIRRYIEGFDNLQTIGRNGMHRYNNMDHSMLTGMFAAQNISGACHDLWAINEDKDYLEEEERETDVPPCVPSPVREGLFAGWMFNKTAWLRGK